MKKTLFAAALLFACFGLAIAQTAPAPKANVVQTLIDTAKIVDPQERLKAYDALAKVLSPERVAPNPWTVSLTKDDANDLRTYVIKDAKIFDSKNDRGLNISIVYFRKTNADESVVKLYLSGDNVKDFSKLSFGSKTTAWKAKYENGDTSQDNWSFGDIGSYGDFYYQYWGTSFAGKMLHEFSGHDSVFFINGEDSFKFDLRGLAVALSKYSLSLDELIKVAENSQGQ